MNYRIFVHNPPNAEAERSSIVQIGVYDCGEATALCVRDALYTQFPDAEIEIFELVFKEIPNETRLPK